MRRSRAFTLFARTLRVQARDSPIADKDWTDFGVAAFGWWRHFKIENADAPTLFAIIRAAVAGSDHDASIRSFFAAKVNHGVRDRRIAIDVVGAAPKQQVAWLERIELK